MHSGGSRSVFQSLEDPYILQLLRFSFWEALLSTVLSIGLAFPVAKALQRRNFRGKRMLIRWANLSLVIPAPTAVLGLISVHGNNGWLRRILEECSISPPEYIYGLSGILIAHVFLNLPFAARTMLIVLDRTPTEYWRLASQLDLHGVALFRWIEWPALRGPVLSLAGLIFVLCFCSFAVVLMLGGGPWAATLEVGIYQAIRIDFDVSQAASLAVLQLFCTIPLAGLLSFMGSIPDEVPPLFLNGTSRPDCAHTGKKIFDIFVLLAAGFFILAPLTSVLLAGVSSEIVQVLQEPLYRRAVRNSLGVGLGTGIMATLIAFVSLLVCRALRQGSARGASRKAATATAATFLETGSITVLAIPPFVLGAGLFILLHPQVNAFSWALSLTALIGAMAALPLALRVLAPTVYGLGKRYDLLCRSLGVFGWNRWIRIEAPELLPPLFLSLGITSALGLGNLGVIALFGGSAENITLPLMLYNTMYAYKMDAASVMSLNLLLICLCLFFVFERIGRQLEKKYARSFS